MKLLIVGTKSSYLPGLREMDYKA